MVLWREAVRPRGSITSRPTGRWGHARRTARPDAPRAGYQRARRNLLCPLLALAVIGGMLLHTPIVTRGWDAGEHLSPEQRARHALLNALGHTDHHGAPHDITSPAPGRSAGAGSVAGLAPGPLPAVAAHAPFTVSLDGPSCQPAQPGGVVTPATVTHRAATADAAWPGGCRPEPLELPPRTAG